jgi:hypothetical protein
VYAQISLPVSPSSATTRVPLETYITPLTTSGTEVAPPPSRVVQASFSDETLLTLICFNGEKRSAARSRLIVRQSPSGTAFCPLPDWAKMPAPTAMMPASENPKKRFIRSPRRVERRASTIYFFGNAYAM